MRGNQFAASPSGRHRRITAAGPADTSGRSSTRRLITWVACAASLLAVAAVATAARPDAPADTGRDGAGPVPARSDLPRPVPDGPGSGVQAAVAHGWKPVGGDEFDAGLGRWSSYDGIANGRRSPGAVTTRDGMLAITGDASGTTGGVSWNEARRFGRWEVRARFPAGDPRYRPVLLLWPHGTPWPVGGEIDFAETASGSDGVSFVLHHGADNGQLVQRRQVDITQWHNYAVEWTATGVTGYLDGEQWFTGTDPATLPPGQMRVSIQLDHAAGGDPPQPTEMLVDWMRLYE